PTGRWRSCWAPRPGSCGTRSEPSLDLPLGGSTRLRLVTEHLTIGAFARLTGLSLKALRRYDESGLLVPHAVDERTGYRYYVPTQAWRARQISLLRSLDMPLAQIADLLETADPVAAGDTLLGWWTEQERLLT